MNIEETARNVLGESLTADEMDLLLLLINAARMEGERAGIATAKSLMGLIGETA